jgi:crossover junction endodeoxyribonuclease RusA
VTASHPRLAAGTPVPAALPGAIPVALGNPASPQLHDEMRGGAGTKAPRTWTIELPPGTQLLTMNQRMHHMVTARLTKTLRETAGWLARAQHIPHLEAAWIVCELTVPDKRRRDPANWMPTAKACVDGLVDAGVLEDDDFSRVRGPDMRLNVAGHRERYGRGGVFTVCITELDGAP